jgi:ankyrin repeat protein
VLHRGTSLWCLLGVRVVLVLPHQFGDSGLHIAATHGDVDMMSLLFDELGAVVDSTNKVTPGGVGWGQHCRMQAVLPCAGGGRRPSRWCRGYLLHSCHPCSAFVRACVCPCARQDGETTLHLASLFAHKPAVDFLAERAPFLISTGNKFGDTPLHYAAIAGSVPVLRSLLKWVGSKAPSFVNAQNAVCALITLLPGRCGAHAACDLEGAG